MRNTVLCALALVGLVAFIAKAEDSEAAAKVDPSEVVILDDENFQDIVFPNGEDSEPFLVMFFAPWCPHCTNLKPIFANASKMAREENYKAARFGIFDGTQTTTKLQEKHGVSVRSYPTMYYSIRGQLHKYEAGRGITHFVYTSRLLHIQLNRPNGILDNVGDEEIAKQIDQQGRYTRAAFVIGLKGAGNMKVPKPLLRIIESTMTIGKTRHGFYNIDDEKKSSYISSGDLESTMKTARKNECEGPGGAFLAVESDALEKPTYFCGEQWLSEDETRPSTELKAWINKNAFPAIEAIDGESWPVLASRGMVLVGVLANEQISKKETAVLRSVAQSLNKVQDPVNDVVVGWLSAEIHADFLEQVGVPKFVPTVFVLNPKKEEAFYVHEGLAKTIQEEGLVGKGVEGLINTFGTAVAKGEVESSKYSWYGKVAQIMQKVPPLRMIQDLLKLGDLEYVAVAGMIVVAPLLLFLAARAGPAEEYPREMLQQRQRQAVRGVARDRSKKEE